VGTAPLAFDGHGEKWYIYPIMKAGERMKVRVIIRLKAGVLDPQGKAIEKTAGSLGYTSFNGFRLGKIVEFEAEGIDRETAIAAAEELADKLLANTVIEQYEVQVDGD